MVALMVILPGTRSDNSLLWRLCPEVRLQVRLVVLQLQYLAVYLYVYLYICIYILWKFHTLYSYTCGRADGRVYTQCRHVQCTIVHCYTVTTITRMNCVNVTNDTEIIIESHTSTLSDVIAAKPCPGLSVFNYQYKALDTSNHQHGYGTTVFVSKCGIKYFRGVY